MTEPSRRPPHLTPPAHLSPSPPLPLPLPLPRDSAAGPDPAHDWDGALSPTRYGDWERNGIAIDF